MDFGDWQAFLDTNTNAYSDLNDFVNVNNFDHLVTSLKQKNIIWFVTLFNKILYYRHPTWIYVENYIVTYTGPRRVDTNLFSH